MEEDTGKSIHKGDKTLLDFNKSGVPLIEIVTEPDFTSKEEVDAFAKRLRQIIRYCDISNADMEKGQMRYELNISIHPSESKRLPDYKVEIKNIGSISVLQKVIDYEVKRQTELLNSGKQIEQETRGVRDMSGVTISQRSKEGSADYRYFPEPDIPPMRFDKKQIENVRKEIPELPQEKKWRYIQDYQLEPDTAETIVSYKSLYSFFEDALAQAPQPAKLAKDLSNWLVGDLRKLSKKHSVILSNSKVTPEYLVELVQLVQSGSVSKNIAKDVLSTVFNTGESPEDVIRKNNLAIIGDQDKLAKIVSKVIEANPKIVEDYKNRNANAIKFLVGQVMKETKGQADPILARQLLEKLLQSL